MSLSDCAYLLDVLVKLWQVLKPNRYSVSTPSTPVISQMRVIGDKMFLLFFFLLFADKDTYQINVIKPKLSLGNYYFLWYLSASTAHLIKLSTFLRENKSLAAFLTNTTCYIK